MDKHRYFFHRVILLGGLFLLAGIATGARRNLGYLPSMGPAPLRFEVPPPAVTLKASLSERLPQPFSSTSAPSTLAPMANSTSPAPTNSTPAKLLSLAQKLEPEPFVSSFAVDPAEGAPTNGAPMLLTSEFVTYLKPLSTNAPVSNLILVPVFVPPVPPNSAPSSRALYEIR